MNEYKFETLQLHVGDVYKRQHQYGKMKTTRELLMDATGEDFNARYYVRYLEEKYRNLFG